MKLLFSLCVCLAFATSGSLYAQSDPVVSSYLLDSTPTMGPGIEVRFYFGGSNYVASQFRGSVTSGIVVITDDPTTGSETKPSKPANPTAPAPPKNGADADEDSVATTCTRGGYTTINQPFGTGKNPTILPTDTDYLPGDKDKKIPRGKYADKRPDFRIEGELFDLYTPTPDKTPKGIADEVQKKTERQCSRVIVKLPDPPKGKTIDDIITDIVKEVQTIRDTPDTGPRDDMEELWVVKPDGTIVKLFPGKIK